MTDNVRLQQLLDAIDDCNRQDPNHEHYQGEAYPKELLYGHRMSETLAAFDPNASAELQIACRAQHIERWKIPRRNYPMNRPGYLRWRRELGKYHARRTQQLMEDFGYGEDSRATVGKLLTKQGFKQDPQAQTLEDVVCLVFIQHYLADFAEGKDADKLANILRLTWAKMSQRGQTKALTLPLDSVLKTTLKDALAVE